MKSKVSFSLVGVGGFAKSCLERIIKVCEKDRAILKAVTIRSPHKYQKELVELKTKGIKVYKDYAEMLQQEEGKIDVVAIPTSIHTHKDLAVMAMKKGFNVLIEKPPAATIQEVDEMVKVSRETDRFCAVGFQWMSSKALKQLKNVIDEGKLGKVTTLLGRGIWKRLDSYYSRASWAGKRMSDGKWVLDGSINNPLAHYLNNLIFLSGSSNGANAPLKVRAELYKGHDIEGEDTACLEVILKNGSRLYFYTTLCGEQSQPFLKIIGSQGEASWKKGNILIEYSNGNREIIKGDEEDIRQGVFENVCDYFQEKKSLDCPVESTRPFTLIINGAYESAGGITKIPEEKISRGKERDSITTHIKDIETIIHRAFEKKCLFSDLSIDWAHKSSFFDLENYSYFPRKTKSSLLSTRL